MAHSARWHLSQLGDQSNFLNPRPLSLADGVAFMSSGAFADGAAPVGIVLCDVRRTFSSRVAATKPRVS
jgi:hypothetical protein